MIKDQLKKCNPRCGNGLHFFIRRTTNCNRSINSKKVFKSKKRQKKEEKRIQLIDQSFYHSQEQRQQKKKKEMIMMGKCHHQFVNTKQSELKSAILEIETAETNTNSSENSSRVT